jgi:hypothetical protein
MDEDVKKGMEEANKAMMEEFNAMYDAMDSQQRTGIIALVSLITKYRMTAGYKQFCRAVVQMLKDGALKLTEGG